MTLAYLAVQSGGGASASLPLPPLHSEQLRGFGPWKNFVHDNFPWLEFRDHHVGEFRAEVSAYRIGNGSLTTISAGASEVIRTRHLADASETGFIKLLWQMAGEMELEQDRRHCVIGPGQAAVCDTARPYRIRLAASAHFAVLMLPHDACPGWEHISQKICGAQLGEGPTISAALGALMALTSLPQNTGNSGYDTVLQAVQWMLSASLHKAASELGVSVFQNPRLSRAQRHIIEHIGDPRLDANDLAAALCMSRRSLYMLFKEYRLTPAKMIHDIRLEQSRQLLGDATQQHRKITDIALDHGFGDYATFSRLFKAQYGLTPSEYRLKARAPRA
ncbi:MAG: helix-turn-helix domain-containing protein [Panacagrimonas sp.]